MAVECNACAQVEFLKKCGGTVGEEQARMIIVIALCEMITLLQQLVEEGS